MNVRAVTSFVWMFVPVLVSLTSFAIFTAAGGVLTAEIAFSALGTFSCYYTRWFHLIDSLSTLQRYAIPSDDAA